MVKPEEFERSYVVNQNLPYEMIETRASGDQQSGGVLGKGQRVWMRKPLEICVSHGGVLVYVEDLGVICLDPRRLSHLD